MNETPSDSVQVPKVSIDWYRAAPWWRLVTHAVGIAWRASHLLVCAAALLLTYGLTAFSFWIFQPEGLLAPEDWMLPASGVPALVPFDRDLYQTEFISAMESMSQRVDAIERGPWFNSAPDSYLQVWRRYALYPYQALDLLTVRRGAYLLFNTLVVILIWSFVGGCLSRRTIQELGTRITSPWSDTIRLVLQRWLSIAWAVTMPLALVALIGFAPLMIGWLSNIPAVGPWVAGFLMVPMTIFSLGLGWCAAITLFGFPLSTAAIVCEKQADAFDGVSRAAAYTFQRPVTLIVAVIAAEWIGHFAGSILAIVANTGYSILATAFAMGSIHPIGNMGSWFDGCIRGIVPLLITSFGFSFFWTASAAIYLLLRREVDHAEFDLIDMGVIETPKALPAIPAPPVSDATSTSTD